MAAPPWAASRSRRVEMRLRGLLAGLRARRHVAGGGRAGARPDLPARPVALPRPVDRDRRLQRPPAARLHHGGRQVAAQDHGRRRRSGLSRPAQGLRGSPLRRPLGRRSAGGGTRGRAVGHPRPHRVGCLDAFHAGRPAAGARSLPHRTAAHAGDQDPPVGARPAARMALLQARGAGHLPDPGADGRQPRGRARRLVRLFRQGGQAPQRRRSGAPRRHPAIARAPPARPLARRRPGRARARAGARPAARA